MITIRLNSGHTRMIKILHTKDMVMGIIYSRDKSTWAMKDLSDKRRFFIYMYFQPNAYSREKCL